MSPVLCRPETAHHVIFISFLLYTWWHVLAPLIPIGTEPSVNVLPLWRAIRFVAEFQFNARVPLLSRPFLFLGRPFRDRRFFILSFDTTCAAPLMYTE
ncbi:hypothetical protein F5Y12DRAFT_639059 [Xylaria sp. FL1777]|nr:hypothetical protein F5Y12DRAFT_639059 [Xylaria sp. FL1777]